MSIMPKSSYMQGLHRQFSRFETLDYAFPVFAHLGEQEVLLKEIYVTTDPEDNEEVFGYQERYAEYRFKPDVITGEFKTTLDFWHQGRIFSSAPALNQNFIECSPRYDIVTGKQNIILLVKFILTAKLSDRFRALVLLA